MLSTRYRSRMLLKRFKVKSTPTIVINEGMTLVGQITRDDLAKRVFEAGQGESLTSVLDSMIKSGRAEDAAELLCKENHPEAILPIYLSPEFSTRMGALLAMEEALERNQRVFDPIVGQTHGPPLPGRSAPQGRHRGVPGKDGKSGCHSRSSQNHRRP